MTAPDESEVTARVAELVNVVRVMVCALVNREDEVVVDEWHNQRHTFITVKVHPDDMGFALGKNGEHAAIIRKIANALCRKRGFKTEINIEALP